MNDLRIGGKKDLILGFENITEVRVDSIITKLVITVHCYENPSYVFLFWELRGISPNFHIHVTVSDLYIPRIGPHIFL